MTPVYNMKEIPIYIPNKCVNNENTKSNRKIIKNTLCYCLGIILYILAIIALTISSVCYIIYGIMILVNNKDIVDKCSGSHLWVYVLTSLILVILSKNHQVNTIKNKSKNDDNDDNENPLCTFICTLFCSLIIEFGMGIWGYMELYTFPYTTNITYTTNTTNITYNTNTTTYNSTVCSNLVESDIWTFGLVTMVLQFISTSIIIALVLLYTCASILTL